MRVAFKLFYLFGTTKIYEFEKVCDITQGTVLGHTRPMQTNRCPDSLMLLLNLAKKDLLCWE